MRGLTHLKNRQKKLLMSKEKHIQKLEYLLQRIEREPVDSMIGKVKKSVKVYRIRRKIKQLRKQK